MGCKQLIGGKTVRTRQLIEQRCFSGVGVPNDRHRRDFGLAPRSTAGATLATYLLQTVLQSLDACADQAAVGFQLGFTRSTQAYTTLLPFKVRPATHQTRGQMLKLRQFDLQLAFV